MATSTSLPVRTVRLSEQLTQLFLMALLMVSSLACSQNGQAGGPRRMQVAVGQIKEISMTAPNDRTVRLIGTSDNSEIVDVSPKQSATEANTATSDNAIFLIKGVTVGTAKVVFSEKQTGGAGTERVVRTYVVQVATK